MIEKKLAQYITDYAQLVVISRAVLYHPTWIKSDKNVHLFECSGTQKYPYDVTIDLRNITEIKSTCTCPYDGHGICKHQVASASKLIELIKDKKIKPTVEKEIKSTTILTTFVPNDNGIINMTELNNIDFQYRTRYSNYSPLTFNSISKNKVEGTYDDYRSLLQISFKFEKKTSEMTLVCSCKSVSACYHKALFLNEFIERFGGDYFSEDYENSVKKRVMDQKGYAELLNFEDVYSLTIDLKGIKVVEKTPNVVDDATFEFYNLDRKTFFIPNKTAELHTYGVGLCFERNKKQVVDIYPFYGRLDKTKSKISTKFRTIDEGNLLEILSIIDSNDDREFITKSIQLFKYQSISNHRDLNLEETKQLIHVFSGLLERWTEQPFFLYDRRNSFVKKNLQELTIQQELVTPILKITEKKPFYQLDFRVKINHKIYEIASNKLIVLPFGIILEEAFYPILNPEIAFSLMKASLKPQMNVIHKGIDYLREKVIDPFSKVFEIEFAALKSIPVTEKNNEIEKHVYLSDEEGKYIVFHPLVKYGDSLVAPESNEKIWKDKSKLNYRERNVALENDFMVDFRALHPNFKKQSNYFYLNVAEALQSFQLMEIIEKLQAIDIRIFGLNNLKSIQYNLNKPIFSIGFSSGTDWFDLNIDVAFGDQSVDLKQIQKSILKQSNFVELKDGTIGILPKEWIEKYKKYFKLGQVKKDKIEISNFQFNIIDELYEQETNTPKFLQDLYEKKKRLANLKDLKTIPKPKHIKATLRPYQQDGLNWLVFLHENQLGGCLADDMGLGKTLQTITFLQYLKNSPEQENAAPHLIIAPTSLMFNWLAELEKFAPKLKVLSFIGINRNELIDQIPHHDVILTTYGSVVKDIEIHQHIEYNYIILDESQAIKNPQSQRFKAVRLLKGHNRLALTGTPIENNTFDLYSQFSFLNPGIFGSIKHFKSTFSEAIDKDQDQETSDLLARMIHPFILRRTKNQVATELPTKTEVVIYCEMGKEQRKVYDYFKQHFKQKLQEQIENEGINKSQMYILQGLTKLRQICNSSALADSEKDYGSESTKLDELVRHLTEKVSNHKILVFSQFVGMLQLVKKRLEQEGILFEYLDGQTRNREERVNNFQGNPEIRVFLISLKAGGTGLNLTEADYVYLIDPWWNPAVESQAIDRCYRIGQDKKVMAYRMICKDTIEEKIVQLQDKKKTVASDIIRVDSEKKSFNKKDVELFFGE